MKFPHSDLWRFSVDIYQRPDVEPTCLELQDRYQVDVNILLYCCWLGQQHRLLNSDQINTMMSTTQPWHASILQPLRDAHKMMKNHIIALPAELLDQTIDNIKEMELNAERMAQLSLEKCFSIEALQLAEADTAAACATQNLMAYTGQIEAIGSIGDISQQISLILAAIFDDEESVQMALMAAAV